MKIIIYTQKTDTQLGTGFSKKGDSMKVIAMGNVGSGGKTVVVTSLAVVLAEVIARRNKKILLIDADSQAQATYGLGQEPSGAMYRWINSLVARRDSLDVDPLDGLVVKDVRPGLDLLPSDETLKYAVQAAANRLPLTISAMRPALEAVASEYDLILVDTKPQDHLSSMFAIAADLILTPVPMREQDAHKLENYCNFLPAECAVARIEQPPVIVIPTRYAQSTSFKQYDELRDSFATSKPEPGQQWAMFEHPIPETIDASHSFGDRVPLVEYKSRNETTARAKEALRLLAAHVLTRLGMGEAA